MKIIGCAEEARGIRGVSRKRLPHTDLMYDPCLKMMEPCGDGPKIRGGVIIARPVLFDFSAHGP